MPQSVSIPFNDLRQIECFLTLADTLHFRSAAEQLHIPQPHLSRTIRRLEERLGVELFRRTSRRVELSPAGTVFAEEARALWGSAERATRRTQLAADGAAGTLAIGFLAAAAFDEMPGHVTSFVARYPEVAVELTEHGSADLWEALRTYTIDIAYVRPTGVQGFRVEELTTEVNCVVTLDTDPVARLTAVPLAALHERPFVYFPRRRGARGYDGLTRTFARAGVEPRLVIEVPSVIAALGFVRAGAGFTLLPRGYHYIAPDLSFVPLDGDDAPVRLVIATREDPGPLVETYLAHVEQRRALAERAAADRPHP
jgi:DNA-binding transcriptional LysR family regulator